QHLVDSGIWCSPTIQTGYRRMIRAREVMERAPTESVARTLKTATAKVEGNLEVVSRLRILGARIVMGTDAIASFGDYAIGPTLFVKAGASPLEAMRAATSVAAEAIGLADKAGVIATGRPADLV